MNDEGIYATIARDLLHGGLPYASLFDVTPPVTYLWYALGFVIFGEAVWVPRLMLAFSLCATTVLIYVEARLLFSKTTALCSAFVFAASTGLSQLGVFAIDDYFVLLPITGSLVACTMAIQRESPVWLAGAGILSGIALITNQSSAVGFLFLAFLSWRSLDRKAATLAVLGGGVSLVLAAMALPYLITGNFGALWYGFVEYPLRYGDMSSLSERLDGLSRSVLAFVLMAAPLVLLAGRGAFLLLRKTSSGHAKLIPIAWAVASFIALTLTGRYHIYYWLTMLPALALLAGVALSRSDGWPVRRTHSLGFALALGAALLLSVGLNARMYIQPTGEAKLIAWAHPQDQVRAAQSSLVAQYIARNTKPQDTIYNLGSQGELYYYADRRPASRFFHQWPIFLDASNQRALLRDLERNKPTYIIDTQWPAILGGEIETYYWNIREFIAENYEHETRIYFDDHVLKTFELVTHDTPKKLMFYGDLYRLKTAN